MAGMFEEQQECQYGWNLEGGEEQEIRWRWRIGQPLTRTLKATVRIPFCQNEEGNIKDSEQEGDLIW